MPHARTCRLVVACCAVAIGALDGGLASSAFATQYDLVTLTTQFNLGEAYGIYRGQVVGDGVLPGATYWPTPAQPISLGEPAGWQGSFAYGIGGNQQVGKGIGPDHNSHALLWQGTAASLVDLTPGAIGWADATDGAQQVGMRGDTAALWTGTPGSYVNLDPPTLDLSGSSEAHAVWNGIQVGWAGYPRVSAILWRGSASSYVVLKAGAMAYGISRGQVVGEWSDQAVLWNGYTPDTFVNLSPPNTTGSELFATNGFQQVGYVSLNPGGGFRPTDFHAGVWHGTASSFQMLPLPPGDNGGYPWGIDGNGDIVGEVGVESNGSLAGPTPIMWVPHRLPGDANFDGKVDFSDLLILAQHYGQSGEWVDGEFSGGGTVDFADLLTLAQHYGQSQPAVQYSMVAGVPEPAGLSLLALLGLGAIYRRRGRT